MVMVESNRSMMMRGLKCLTLNDTSMVYSRNATNATEVRNGCRRVVMQGPSLRTERTVFPARSGGPSLLAAAKRKISSFPRSLLKSYDIQ